MSRSWSLLALALLSVFGGLAQPTRQVSSEKSILYGPALNSRIVTPARTAYIQACDSSGNNFTSSAGPDAFKVVVINEAGGNKQQLQAKLKDRGDGTYEFLFFFSRQPDRIIISVKGKDGAYVGASGPVILEHVEAERCYCPAKNTEDWAEQYGCRKDEPQITKELSIFPEITEEIMQKTVETLQHVRVNACFVHYVIKRNQIFGKAYGPFQGFKQYTDDLLQILARRVSIPDVEFVWNLGDWPLANGTAAKLPVVSFCGSAQHDDIIVPTYKMILATLLGKDIESVMDVDTFCYAAGRGWKNKLDKVVWMGRDSHPARLRFVEEVAAKHPQDIVANISKNHFNYYPSEEERKNDKLLQAGKKVNRMKFEEFWKHRYILSIDGTVAAYRLPALLAGDSVVMKQDSEWYEHFYGELEPYTHYIPVKEDLSDVMSQLQWARAHTKKAKQIARNGRLFARERLRPAQLLCYFFRVFEQYSSRMTYKVAVPTGYRKVGKVEQKPAADCKCAPKPKKPGKQSRTEEL